MVPVQSGYLSVIEPVYGEPGVFQEAEDVTEAAAVPFVVFAVILKINAVGFLQGFGGPYLLPLTLIISR